MRLVSYNVRYFGHGLKGLASTAASKERIARAIAELTPAADVVALQEVETRSIRSRVALGGAHASETQLDAFLRHLDREFRARGLVQPYRAWYFPAHVYQLGPVKLYTTGLAFLVNAQTLHVLSDNGHTPHRITYYHSKRFRAAKQTRIAAHLHLEDVKLRKFHVFNTHLSLPTPWAMEFWQQDAKLGWGKNQYAEAKAVSDFVHATAGTQPFLLMGDFNSAPASPVYQYLTGEAQMRGAQEVLKQIDPANPDGFATAGFMALRMHLDHLFGDKKVEFIDLDETRPFGDQSSRFHGLSDHVPLISRVEL